MIPAGTAHPGSNTVFPEFPVPSFTVTTASSVAGRQPVSVCAGREDSPAACRPHHFGEPLTEVVITRSVSRKPGPGRGPWPPLGSAQGQHSASDSAGVSAPRRPGWWPPSPSGIAVPPPAPSRTAVPPITLSLPPFGERGSSPFTPPPSHDGGGTCSPLSSSTRAGTRSFVVRWSFFNQSQS